jgi:hypothetical protein
MFTYDRFVPGEVYGEHRFEVSPTEIAAWHALFGGESDGWMPPGMVSVVAMRAYLVVVTPRPPGNIHGASHFEVRRRVRAGESLLTTVSCETKELRKTRRIVHLGLRCRGSDGAPVFDARVTSLVAA